MYSETDCFDKDIIFSGSTDPTFSRFSLKRAAQISRLAMLLTHTQSALMIFNIMQIIANGTFRFADATYKIT